jgi:thymidylate synthase
MYTVEVRNVNDAYRELRYMLRSPSRWYQTAPRGRMTWEFPEPVATTYWRPTERVLFDAERDANPFFHLVEAVWIAAGRRDVRPLAQFLPSIADYSDDGETFNAAYGYRLRRRFGIDQIRAAVRLLRRELDTRRAFWVIGDPADLARETRDVACNVSVFFRIRDGRLHMTVCNRSNDAVWGAYGANAVQFSVLQELVAAGAGVPVGYYTQVSNSFHVYPDNPKVTQLIERRAPVLDPYAAEETETYALVGPGGTLDLWLEEAEEWLDRFPTLMAPVDPFFRDVLTPMAEAFLEHRVGGNTRAALRVLERSLAHAAETDWLMAGRAWLTRRLKEGR